MTPYCILFSNASTVCARNNDSFDWPINSLSFKMPPVQSKFCSLKEQSWEIIKFMKREVNEMTAKILIIIANPKES